jgi:signal transduction histidine kinase
MKDFFKGVRKHIGRLDAVHLREQYSRVADELAFSETIFDTTSDGYFVLNAKGEEIWANKSAERLLGMKLADILPSLDLPLGKASKKEISISYPEARILDIQTIPMEGDVTLVKLADVTVARNFSKKQLSLGAAEAVKKLASGVAHEIGNPLNAISLNLQMLARDYPDDESIKDCISQIERLDGILKGFLQALKPVKPNLKPCTIAEPIKNTLATLKNQFEERCISVTFKIPSATPVAAIDTLQLQQVFFNILKNSIEAINEKGNISISVDSDDNDVIVDIKDTGSGMDSETISHLFEAYSTTKEHGNGLGLMISQRIITDHGGTINVESTLGEGTRFVIRIPRIEKRVRQLK